MHASLCSKLTSVLWQPCYVRDVANALVNTLNSREPLGATYDLGGPDVLSCARWPPPSSFCSWLAIDCKPALQQLATSLIDGCMSMQIEDIMKLSAVQGRADGQLDL